MKQYHDLLNHILSSGVEKSDRTGTGTISTFGYQMRFDLSKGFPLVTTKKLHTKSIVHELLWFLSGDTNNQTLQLKGVHIWDEWAGKYGNLGPIYGKQWRSWRGKPTATFIGNGYPASIIDREETDQITQVIEQIKTNPDSRRLIVSAWNVEDIPDMALPPCHLLFQFYVANGKLSLQLYQRSGDAFLGVPFNIASYALLLHMAAQVTNLKVGEFVHTIGDAHIYKNHLDQVNLQLSRNPMPLPELVLNKDITSIYDFKYEDISFLNYNSHPSIKGEVAV